MAHKQADLTGTLTMPLQPINPKKPFREDSAVKQSSPWLDVSQADPTPSHVKRANQRYCLSNPQQYPIDDALQIKTAGAYFTENYRDMEPETRREYAFNLREASEKIAFPVSDLVAVYGAPSYASHEHCKLAWSSRKAFTPEEHLPLLQKLASGNLDLGMEPDEFACTMRAFDKKAGLDRHYDKHIRDPWAAVLGPVKVAEYSETLGQDVVTATDLKHLATTDGGRSALKKIFDHHFVADFVADPVAVYKSLPEDQRKLLGRMAASNNQGRGLSVV